MESCQNGFDTLPWKRIKSGFSVNIELLIENMEEKTIVPQRIDFDAI